MVCNLLYPMLGIATVQMNVVRKNDKEIKFSQKYLLEITVWFCNMPSLLPKSRGVQVTSGLSISHKTSFFVFFGREFGLVQPLLKLALGDVWLPLG
jgi:hypothetical protein